MSRKRWFLIVGIALAGVALPGIAWTLQDEGQYARIATGYAAKETCSCLNVSGRDLQSCIADFPAEARGAVRVTQHGDPISTTMPVSAISAQATFEDGFGCAIAD